MSRSGRCHCGTIRYELAGDSAPLVSCHCRDCRRAHGAAFVTSMPVSTRKLRVVAGASSVRQHRQRYFCAECGTRLWNRLDDRPGATMLMVATLEEEPAGEPIMHINLESQAPWYTIRDEAPAFESFPPNVDDALDRLEERD